MTGRTVAPGLDPGLVRLLAEPLRLRIIQMLAVEELCTCHMVEETGAKQPTVSHHLRQLKEAGVVDAEPVGAYTYYRLRPDVLLHMAHALEDLGQQASTAPRRRLPCD